MSGYDFVNRNVLRRSVKIERDGADVTWGGKLFHTIVPETENVRLMTVVRRTGGTASRWEADDLSRCLDVMSPRRVKHDCRYVDAVAWMARYVRTASLKERVGWWARRWLLLLLGRLPKVDLIILEGKKCPSVRTSVRPSTKSFFHFNEVWYVGRGRWVMHDGMPYGRIQGQGQGHEPFKVWIPSIFKTYLLPHLQWELASDH